MVGVANDTATGMAKRKRDSLTDMSDSKRVSVGGPPAPQTGCLAPYLVPPKINWGGPTSLIVGEWYDAEGRAPAVSRVNHTADLINAALSQRDKPILRKCVSNLSDAISLRENACSVSANTCFRLGNLRPWLVLTLPERSAVASVRFPLIHLISAVVEYPGACFVADLRVGRRPPGRFLPRRSSPRGSVMPKCRIGSGKIQILPEMRASSKGYAETRVRLIK